MGCELDPLLKTRAERILGKELNKLESAEFEISPYLKDGRLKRGLDVLISGSSLPFVLPAIFALGVVIFADDGHWPGFSKTDECPGERKIKTWKLRTMPPHPDPQVREAELTVDKSYREVKIQGQLDVTRVGRVLRKTSLDELPQFLLVTKGEWSTVGPRILSTLEWQHEAYPYQGRQPYKGFIQAFEAGVKPGITSLPGISGRADLELEARFWLDFFYTKEASPWVDLKIMAWTIPAVLSGRGAY